MSRKLAFLLKKHSQTLRTKSEERPALRTQRGDEIQNRRKQHVRQEAPGTLPRERGLEASLPGRPGHGQKESHRLRPSPLHQASGAPAGPEVSGFHTFKGQPGRTGNVQLPHFVPSDIRGVS